MHSYATRLQIWINIMIIILVAKEEDYATHLQMLMQLLQMQVRAVTLDACLYAFHKAMQCIHQNNTLLQFNHLHVL